MQLGTGYFGASNANGTFSQQHFLDVIGQAKGKVKAIEIKLSQGAKRGLGGMLPAAKVSAEIAKIRGIPVGKDCVSPSSHSAFANVDAMLDFVEHLADLSGLPIGIKSAVGESEFWDDLITQVQDTERCVDFITIDGSEGGTGAAPLAFSDHVALPFKQAFTAVFKKFELAGIAHNIAPCIGVGVRHDQHRPRADNGDWLCSGATLPFRSLSNRSRNPKQTAYVGTGSYIEIHPPSKLHDRLAKRNHAIDTRLRF